MKKRFVSMLLALAMCMGLAVPAFAAEPSSDISALEYHAVESYIEDSSSSFVETALGPEPVTYYYGDNYIVVNDPNVGGYYLISVEADTQDVLVNGTVVIHDTYGQSQMPQMLPYVSARTKWTPFGDEEVHSMFLSNIAVSVLAGAVASKAMALIQAPANSPLGQTVQKKVINFCAKAGLTALVPPEFDLGFTICTRRYVGNVNYDLGIYDMLSESDLYGGSRAAPKSELIMGSDRLNYIQTHYS